MVKNGMRSVHSGEILREEYLMPVDMNVHALSQALRVPATRLQEIVKERRSITLLQTLSPFALSLMKLLAIRLSCQRTTAKSLVMSKGTALRLARYFGTDAQSWLNLQLSYDLKIAEAELKARIEREVEEMAA